MSTTTMTKKIEAGESLFAEGDKANSLFIIQKGQIRLFKPKGKGFVDLGVLRAGEVIGEMAFFDEKAKERSASATAIVSSEVIEITFEALEKTLSHLNPWFKTLIITLVNRLKTSNDKLKNLENNSVGISGEYKFFQTVDLIKLFSLLHLFLQTIDCFWFKAISHVTVFGIQLNPPLKNSRK